MGYNFSVMDRKGILVERAGLGAALAAASSILISASCGGAPTSTPAAAPAQAAQSSASSQKAPVVTLVEPGGGASAGHIDTFAWLAVEGADGYRLSLTAATDGRSVWQSPVVTATEVRLPPTISLEPEAYFWQVTALHGSAVLAVSPPSRFAVTP